MNDLSLTISPKSDQLNADDLISGPKTIRVTNVSVAPGIDQPVSISFEGDDKKPYKPCKSMRRVLVKVWGEKGDAYAGRSMTLYLDDKVTYGGSAVGGIRISHMSGIDKPVTMALTATRANRKPFTVAPLIVQQQQQAPAKEPTVRDMLRDAFAKATKREDIDAAAEIPAVKKIRRDGSESQRNAIEAMFTEAWAQFPAPAAETATDLADDLGPVGDEPPPPSDEHADDDDGPQMDPEADYIIGEIRKQTDVHAVRSLLEAPAIRAKRRRLDAFNEGRVATAESTANMAFGGSAA